MNLPFSLHQGDRNFVMDSFYFLIYFIFGCVGSSLLCRLSLVVERGGYSSLWCTGFSLQWLLLSQSTGPRWEGFSSCSTQAQQFPHAGPRARGLQQLWHMGSVVVAHGLQSAGSVVWHTGLVAPQHVESSWTRDRTHFPCIGRRILNHCATREVPVMDFFFLTSLLEYNCFTTVCQFLLQNKVNQPYIYIYPHISSLLHLPPTLPIPPLQVVTKHRADLPVLCGCFPLAIYFTFGSLYKSMPLSHFAPASPSPSPCLKSILYVCVFIPVLPPGSSEPFFFFRFHINMFPRQKYKLSTALIHEKYLASSERRKKWLENYLYILKLKKKITGP